MADVSAASTSGFESSKKGEFASREAVAHNVSRNPSMNAPGSRMLAVERD